MILTAALAARSSAKTPKKASSEARAEIMRHQTGRSRIR
jgi:hypothetical protein